MYLVTTPMAYAHSYVHRASIGDAVSGGESVDRTVSVLDALYEAGRIRGFQAYLIEDQEGAEDLLAHIHRGVAELTQGRYPYAFARVQPKEGLPDDIDALMDKHGYVLVASS